MSKDRTQEIQKLLLCHVPLHGVNASRHPLHISGVSPPLGEPANRKHMINGGIYSQDQTLSGVRASAPLLLQLFTERGPVLGGPQLDIRHVLEVAGGAVPLSTRGVWHCCITPAHRAEPVGDPVFPRVGYGADLLSLAFKAVLSPINKRKLAALGADALRFAPGLNGTLVIRNLSGVILPPSILGCFGGFGVALAIPLAVLSALGPMVRVPLGDLFWVIGAIFAVPLVHLFSVLSAVSPVDFRSRESHLSGFLRRSFRASGEVLSNGRHREGSTAPPTWNLSWRPSSWMFGFRLGYAHALVCDINYSMSS